MNAQATEELRFCRGCTAEKTGAGTGGGARRGSAGGWVVLATTGGEGRRGGGGGGGGGSTLSAGCSLRGGTLITTVSLGAPELPRFLKFLKSSASWRHVW